jgi:predicted transcriptional regulator
VDIQITGHHLVVAPVDVVESIMNSDHHPVVEVVVEDLSHLGVVEDAKINLVIS